MTFLKDQTTIIWILEDNEVLQRNLSLYLSTDFPRLRSFTRAEDALDALDGPEQPELVVLDIQLPGMNGLEFLMRLRKHPLYIGLPVLILSSLGKQEEVIRGLVSGATDYVTKPFSLEELRLRIHGLLNIRKPPVIENATDTLRNKIRQALLSYWNKGKHPELKDLADDLGWSISTFNRRCNDHFSATPSVVVQELRMERAKELLAAGFDNMSEVAYRLGYEHPSTFSLHFKNFYGLPPKKFAGQVKK